MTTKTKKETSDSNQNLSFFSTMHRWVETGDVSQFFDVLNKSYSDDANLDLKSEIHNPRIFALLDVIIEELEYRDFKRAVTIWKTFRQSYVRLMVSYKRGGRIEMVEMMKEIIKDEMKESKNSTDWD